MGCLDDMGERYLVSARHPVRQPSLRDPLSLYDDSLSLPLRMP
eukprot:SAG22_NODE_2144_length_2941_cov_2.511963_1_plen_42_part_10